MKKPGEISLDAEGAYAQVTLRQKDRFWTDFVERAIHRRSNRKRIFQVKRRRRINFFEALFILKGE